MLARDVVKECVIEDSGGVEVIEEVGVLRHAVRVVLCHKFEGLDELLSIHNLHLSLELADNILEFIENQQCSVTVF